MHSAAQALIERTRSLVDIESVSLNEAAITDFIRASLPSGARIAYDEDSVLFVTLDDPELPMTVLAGHTDTVPLAGAALPARLEGPAIVGRGTTDMKGALAVMLELAHHWQTLDPAQRTAGGTGFALIFFGREELPPAHNPLPAFFERHPAISTTDLVVLMEPTSNAIELGCLGNLNLTLQYRGRSAHSARPWTGINAAHVAISELGEVAKSQPQSVELGGLEFRNVVSVTGFRSGVARNVVPGSAEVDVNVRYAWSDASKDEVEALWAGHFPGADIDVVGHALPAPPVAEPRLIADLQAAGAGEARPKQAWTNAADFAAIGVPVLHFGPGTPELAHTDEEAVEVEALERCFETLARFLPGRPASR